MFSGTVLWLLFSLVPTVCGLKSCIWSLTDLVPRRWSVLACQILCLSHFQTRKGLWLVEPQSDTYLALDVAGKGLFKKNKNHFWKFREIFRKFSENFKGNFQKLFKKILRIKSFCKIWTFFLENFERYFGNLREILLKFLKISLKI